MDASGSQQLLDEWDNISDSEFLNIPCEQQTIGKKTCLLGAPKMCNLDLLGFIHVNSIFLSVFLVPHRPLSRETDCEHSVDFNSPITPTSSVYK